MPIDFKLRKPRYMDAISGDNSMPEIQPTEDQLPMESRYSPAISGTMPPPPAPYSSAISGDAGQLRQQFEHPPQISDYKKNVGFGGKLAAAFLGPEWAQQHGGVTDYQNAMQDYSVRTQGLKGAVGLDASARAADLAQQKEDADTLSKKATASQYDLVPLSIPGQSDSVMVPRKDAARIMQGLAHDTSAQAIATGKNQTAEEIATGKNTTATGIAAGHDATSLQNTQTRTSSAGDKESGTYLPVPDASGNTVGWVNPKSRRFVHVSDIEGAGAASGGGDVIPPKPSAQSISRSDQAGVIMRAGDGLINDISTHRAKLGNTKAIIESAVLNTPWSDPETQELRAEIASYAALQPAMHGFRGTDALKQFEKLLGGIPNNPDSLIAAIRGIRKTAGAFNPKQQSQDFGPANGKPEGSTGSLNGTKVVVKGGRIVSQ